MKICELTESKKWPVSDTAIDKVNDYINATSSEEWYTATNDNWSVYFTDDQIDSGEFDEFMDYAFDRWKKGRG